MTLEEKLTALLMAVCPRTYPDVAPVSTTLPYITWQQIGGEAITCVDRTFPSTRNALVQITVWSARRAEAVSLIEQCERALIESTEFQAAPASAPAADYDSDMDRRSARQDFSIWADR